MTNKTYNFSSECPIYNKCGKPIPIPGCYVTIASAMFIDWCACERKGVNMNAENVESKENSSMGLVKRNQSIVSAINNALDMLTGKLMFISHPNATCREGGPQKPTPPASVLNTELTILAERLESVALRIDDMTKSLDI